MYSKTKACVIGISTIFSLTAASANDYVSTKKPPSGNPQFFVGIGLTAGGGGALLISLLGFTNNLRVRS